MLESRLDAGWEACANGKALLGGNGRLACLWPVGSSSINGTTGTGPMLAAAGMLVAGSSRGSSLSCRCSTLSSCGVFSFGLLDCASTAGCPSGRPKALPTPPWMSGIASSECARVGREGEAAPSSNSQELCAMQLCTAALPLEVDIKAPHRKQHQEKQNTDVSSNIGQPKPPHHGAWETAGSLGGSMMSMQVKPSNANVIVI
mmetsp:Transcript_15731/g.36171  ORF Transcript_15731/g.36171 Transcript_15731/m.36171 type:complete len:202 (+) Transcript_15731:236-841(+)